MEQPAAFARKDQRAGNAIGAVDRDRRSHGVQRGNNVNGRRIARFGRAAVIRPIDGVHLNQADAAEPGDDAGRDPFAARIHRFHPRRDHKPASRRHNLSVAHDHGRAIDGRAAIADDQARIGDRNILRIGANADHSADGGAGEARHAPPGQGFSRLWRGAHFTSPSPGWPSSKSLTGRRPGSLAS